MVPRNLYAHVRDIHYWKEKDVTLLKVAYKRSKSNEENEFPCECGQIFFGKKGLLAHQQKVHGLDNESGWVVCPVCGKRFTRYTSLAEHCQNCHCGEVPGQDYNVIRGHMENWQTFEDWKHAKELATRTNFVIRRTYETIDGRTIIFVCQHSRGTGKDVDVLAVRKRYRIPRRINSHCTALNVVRLENGSVQYFGCWGHIRHTVTTATLPLPPEDEAVIVEMLKSGLSPSVILTKIRSERWDPLLDFDMQPRICFTTLKDIKYIAEKRGLVEGRLHKNDILSLEELLKSSADIVDYVYVKSFDPTGDGFISALMTRSGKKFLERYGCNGLVFDDTFNVTRYCFRLATLLVANDAGKGFPCCFLISYRMTSDEVSVLFGLVKKWIPHFDARYIMTDDTNVFYDAFNATFPHSRAQKILSLYYIKQRLLFSKKNTLLSSLGFAQKTPMELYKYDSYMERFYSSRKEEWAPCYRRIAPFATSNHAESWHHMLKHVLLHEKQSSRLDNLVYTLVRYSADLELKLISQAMRCSTDGKGRRTQTLRRHRDAITHYAERQGLIIPLRENTWGVVSKSQEEVLYTVYIGMPCNCDSMDNSHCERCGVCFFQVSCDCPDSLNAGVSCIHCHAVAIYAPEARQLLPIVQHPYSSSHEAASQSSATSADVEGTCELSSVDMEGQSMPSESSVEVLHEISQQDETNVEYHKLKGAESHLDEIARKCLQEGLAGALRELRISVEQGIDRVLSTAGITFEGPARRTVVQSQGKTPKPKSIVPYKTKKQVRRERQVKSTSLEEIADQEIQHGKLLQLKKITKEFEHKNRNG